MTSNIRWKLVRDVVPSNLDDGMGQISPMEIVLPTKNKHALLIGSMESSLCDIRLDSRFVSKSHCQIVSINQEWYLQDSGSTNGTYCNGHLVKDVQDIHESDKLGFGVPGFNGVLEELYPECFIFELVKETDMSSVDNNVPAVDAELEGALEGNPNFQYQLPSRPKYAYKCKICPSCFDRPEKLIEHARRHGANPPFPYQCNYCDYSCDSKTGQTYHYQKHEMQKDFQHLPRRSPAQGSSSNATMRVVKSVAKKRPGKFGKRSGATPVRSEKRMTCDHCPATFDSNKDRSQHLERHGPNSGPFKCHMCSYGTKRNYHLAAHMEIHNTTSGTSPAAASSASSSTAASSMPFTYAPPSAEGFKCTKCPATFTLLRDFRSHTRKHGIPSSHPCHLCDYGAGRSDYLQKHLLVHKQAGKIDVHKPGETFKCSQCPALFKQSRTLNQHISLHDSGHPFKCRFCSYASNLSWARRKHELIHNIVTKKKSKLSSSRALLSAKYADIGIRKYSRISNLCSAEEFKKLKTGNPRFVYKDIYKSMPSGFIKIKTTYKCFKCPSAFPGVPALERHKSLHGANLKYRCNVCDYSAVNTVLIQRHSNLHASQRNLKPTPYHRKDIATKSTGKSFSGMSNYTKPDPDRKSHVKQLQFDFPAKVPPPSPSFDIYSVKDLTSKTHEKLAKQLITSLKVTNFMCFTEMEVPAIEQLQAFYGESEKGKSASILALLLGIGYDVGLPDYTPESLCGWELTKDVVRRGSETALIELVISLNSSAELEEQYGTHMKLDRLIYKGVPLASSKFEISSADTLKRHASTPKAIGLAGLRSVLAKLNVLPVYSPIQHLDRPNMQKLLDNPGSWYDFFKQSIKSQQQVIRDKLKDLEMVSKRIKADIHWRNLKLDFHSNQLKADYPVDDSPFQEWRKIDINRHIETKKELEEIRQKEFALEKFISSFNDELTELPSLILRQMQSTYCKFLHSNKLGGGVVIDDSRKKIGLWVREMTFCGDEKPPSNVDEAEAAWEYLSRQKKHMAIIGLFLAFWKCIEDCPFFTVDSHSSSELEFRFPKNGLPVLMELMTSKRRTGQQFFVSLPSGDV